MDGTAVAFIVILGVEVAAIGGLVAYLLFRPSDRKKKPKQLEPEEKVATDYGEPTTENGQALLDVKAAPQDTPSIASTTSSDFKKPLKLDSISIEIDTAPLYNEPPQTVIEMDGEPPPDSSSAPPLYTPERKEEVSDKLSSSGSSSEEEDKVPIYSTRKGSISSTDDDNRKLVNEPIDQNTALYSQESPDKESSSSSSSEDEVSKVDEPAIAPTRKTPAKNEPDDLEKLLSDQENEVPVNLSQEISSSSSSDDEKNVESFHNVLENQLRSSFSSSSSTSEDEKNLANEPLINESRWSDVERQRRRAVEKPVVDKDEKHLVEEPLVGKAHYNDDEEPQRRHSYEEPVLGKEKKHLVEEPLVGKVHHNDDEETHKHKSSSSSSLEGDAEPAQISKPIPVKRTTILKESFEQESISSSSSSTDESSSNKKLMKAKRRRNKQHSTASSSGDERIINHKKKTHRKRYIHNIEEVEIIEEHTFNKTHKKIYKKAPPGEEEVSSNESEKEESTPVVYTSKIRRVKKRNKDIAPGNRSFSSSSSTSEEEEVKDKQFHSEYRFNVDNEKTDKNYVTTKMVKTSSPKKHPKKHRTYTETIREDKTKKLEMCMSGSHSESDTDARMRSEKTIPISSTSHFQPISKTLTLERKEATKEQYVSSSSSSSSESDAEQNRLRSEARINIRSPTPTYEAVTKIVAVQEEHKSPAVVKEQALSSSSSSSSESEAEQNRLRSEARINMRSPVPTYETITKTVTVQEEIKSPELEKSSSSESDANVTKSSSTQIQLKAPQKREVFTSTITSTTTTTENTVATSSSSDSSSDEKEMELPPSNESFTTSSSSSSSSDEEEKVEAASANQSLKVSTIVQKFDKKVEVAEENTSKTTVNTEYVDISRRVAVDESTAKPAAEETGSNKMVSVDQNVSNSQEAKERAVTDTKLEVEEDLSKTTITTEEVVVTTTTREKKKKSRKDFKFTSGWKRQVSLVDLFQAGVVSQDTMEQLEEGKIEQAEVEKSIRVYLVGEEPIAGLIMSDTGEKVSIYDAWKKALIRRGTSISLLEAQAATGRIIDPKTAEKMSVTEATHKRLIDRQFEAVLVRAERAVYGYKTRLSNETLSLFEAMKRGLVVENHGVRLLEAQIATGGIVDPNANHRLPVEVAYKRGLFDERINSILEDPSDDTRGFFDPNTEENLTYLELMERCVIDKDTGLRLLPFRSKKKKQPTTNSKVVFESSTRRQVLLQDVVAADYVDKQTAKKFDDGAMTKEEVSEMVAKLKVYVDGILPIAGVINSSTGEKMTILEACRSGLIRKGTAFELLEAQAACDKIIDVQIGKPVSKETAVRTGVIDKEFEDVVTRASRAVTGYREPFKREVLSLCEAMTRHLVVERHAIRLLEAQIATGGIVDMKSPVRIKVGTAAKRGLLDRSLAQKLERRETKSYFDPVTGENLNYSELMGRCVLDKDTNLLFLMLEGGTVTPNVLPFEPEPESKKIREKSHTSISTEVVQSKKKKKKRSSRTERTVSPPPEKVPSSPPAILSRRVVIVDPNTGNELSVKEALEYKLIDEDTARQLRAQEGDFEDE